MRAPDNVSDKAPKRLRSNSHPSENGGNVNVSRTLNRNATQFRGGQQGETIASSVEAFCHLAYPVGGLDIKAEPATLFGSWARQMLADWWAGAPGP